VTRRRRSSASVVWRLAVTLGAASVAMTCGFVPGASALVIDSGDGRGNTEAPPGLAEWANVGHRWGGPSVVYVGQRWVLTAGHVGAGIVVLGGERFDPIAGTQIPISNADGSPADLLLFRLDRDPGLPPLRIARNTPRIGQEVILVGAGASRGARLTVDAPGIGLLDGFRWSPDDTVRWGTNVVSGPLQLVRRGDVVTHAIPMAFERIDDPAGTDHEAAAGHGDSGGALFALEDALMPERGYVLSGILFSVSAPTDQPADASLYGNVTFAVDLATYRGQLIDVIRPACSNERDDDGDGRIDFPDDPGCVSGEHDDESTEPEIARPLGRWLTGLFLAVLVWRGTALFRARSR